MGLAVHDGLLIFLESLGCLISNGNETHLVSSNQNSFVILKQSIGDRLYEPGGVRLFQSSNMGVKMPWFSI